MIKYSGAAFHFSGSGYALCKEIRASSQIPVIFLTALDEEANVVAGLDLGADDYMTKPIRTKELVSRIKAVLRRNVKPMQDVNVWQSQDIELRVLEGSVYKNKQELMLTGLEYKLLLMLMTHPKQICSRSAILHHLWECPGNLSTTIHSRFISGGWGKRWRMCLPPPNILSRFDEWDTSGMQMCQEDEPCLK